MTKEFTSLVMAGTSLLGFLAFSAGGAWYMRGLQERIISLEGDDSRLVAVELRMGVGEQRLNAFGSRQDIDDDRWAKHFNLWGTEIRSAEVAAAATPTDFTTPTRVTVATSPAPPPTPMPSAVSAPPVSATPSD